MNTRRGRLGHFIPTSISAAGRGSGCSKDCERVTLAETRPAWGAPCLISVNAIERGAHKLPSRLNQHRLNSSTPGVGAD